MTGLAIAGDIETPPPGVPSDRDRNIMPALLDTRDFIRIWRMAR